jgi:hypothetical protein
VLPRLTAADVLGISHSAHAISSRHADGIRCGGREMHKLEYTALVLVRDAG